MGSMTGKVALVTGGASGIGRDVALTFAREGARIAIGDVAVEGGETTARLIRARGGEAMFQRTDVAEVTDLERLIGAVLDRWHRLDFANNNAGIEGERAPTEQCTEENWDRVMDVNLKGVWRCMKLEIRQMLQQGGGAIVNTASILGLSAIGIGIPSYIAAKHGVIGLTRAAALEYGANGIRVNAVCPSMAITPIIERLWEADPQLRMQALSSLPLGRVGSPQEVAEVVVWLCSDAASYVNGHSMSVDGGRLIQ